MSLPDFLYIGCKVEGDTGYCLHILPEITVGLVAYSRYYSYIKVY